MNRLEHRIPPPVVGVACALLMWLLARSTPSLTLLLPGSVFIAVLLALAGLAVSAAGILAFRKARTTVNPLEPGNASTIVATGIFARTRNPMYLGMLVELLAWATYLSNPAALLGAVAFVLYINRFQIGPEERALAAKFGDSYAAYLTRVRRWI